MSFIKIGQAEINHENLLSEDIVLADPEIRERFEKLAFDLRKIAPKANDFLYFSAVMMHAAESSTINDDGSPKYTKSGEVVKASWEKKANGSWKWVCNEPTVKAYRNQNADIFPEEELIKAHKKWIGKPLCVDHKSSSVDAIRGIIVDTYYDYPKKRVIALCALDKANYPDLARKVSTKTSTSVSMGTGVKTAICTDCGAVCQTSVDFCRHMTDKTRYGEINVGLDPIELSIVVNGADPKAQIKHVYAAAQNIQNYLDKKQSELTKVAYSAEDLKKHQSELGKNAESLKKIMVMIQEVMKSLEMSSKDIDSSDVDDNSADSATPSKKYIEGLEPTGIVISPAQLQSTASVEFDLTSTIESIQKELSKLSGKIDNLENNIGNSSNMKKESYYQGGGGVNEPTMGKPKYPVDPLAAKAREEDKHMVGQHDGDVGDVEGMHPGVDSVNMSEMERKQKLLRASVEERSQKRALAVEKALENSLKTKEAYFQGGGGVNEPTPGKPKYKPDPLAEKVKKEDKQMVGQKPFPDVGDVEGLHPSPASVDVKDELKRKQMLSRASLKAKFVKAANFDGSENLSKSAWQVFLGDKLVSTATVHELSNGQADLFYDSIATKEFGSKMLDKYRSQLSSFAQAQPATDMSGSQPAAAPASSVPASGSAPAAAPASSAPVGTDPNASPEGAAAGPEEAQSPAEMSDALQSLLQQAQTMASDLGEAVKALSGEKAEMADVEDMGMPKAASLETKSLFKMREDLNRELSVAMKKAALDLTAHAENLEALVEVVENGVSPGNRKQVVELASQEISDSQRTFAEVKPLLQAFSKYARGTEALVKRAQAEEALVEVNMSDDMANLAGDPDELALADIMHALDAENTEYKPHDMSNTYDSGASKDMHDHDESCAEDCDAGMGDDDELKRLPEEVESDSGFDSLEANDAEGDKDNEDEDKADMSKEAQFDLTTKEGRAAYRIKLAQDVQYSELLDDSADLTNQESFGDKDNGHVENVGEVHDSMMEVIKKTPTGVLKDAQAIHKLVSEGTIDKEDVDQLVAHGADAAAVAYYKKYFGELKNSGSEFADALVKEHNKAQVEKEKEEYKAKYAQAYKLAQDMARAEVISATPEAVDAQIDEIMTWNDAGFDSAKRSVAKTLAKLNEGKTALAGRMPQVGLSSVEERPVVQDSFQQELVRALMTGKHLR